MPKKIFEELNLCLKLWKDQGHCEFGGHNECKACASPYLLWKIATGEVLHGKNQKRLSLNDWQEMLAKKWT